jgi:hypothetical protein
MSQKSDVKRVGPKNDPKNRAALITGAALLVVKKVDKADGYLYAAILIHEFMRFLLHHNEVDLTSLDVEEEEILTDLAAVFTGFGPVMMLGYCPVEDKEHTHLFGYDASSLGYLNVDQLAYIERRYVLVLDARIR